MRPLGYVRIAFGAALVAGSATTVRHGLDRPSLAFVRVLGLRQIAEAVLLARHSERWLVAGSAVDAIHAVTVAGIAVRSPSHRRLALLNLATAALLAVEGLRESRGGRAPARRRGQRARQWRGRRS